MASKVHVVLYSPDGLVTFDDSFDVRNVKCCPTGVTFDATVGGHRIRYNSTLPYTVSEVFDE